MATNGAVMGTTNLIGISSTAGDTSAGTVLGDSLNYYPVTTVIGGASLVGFRVSIAAQTTMYFKASAQFTGGTPTYYGRLTAYRRR